MMSMSVGIVNIIWFNLMNETEYAICREQILQPHSLARPNDLMEMEINRSTLNLTPILTD
jgi:hypothetical protein